MFGGLSCTCQLNSPLVIESELNKNVRKTAFSLKHASKMLGQGGITGDIHETSLTVIDAITNVSRDRVGKWKRRSHVIVRLVVLIADCPGR